MWAILTYDPLQVTWYPNFGLNLKPRINSMERSRMVKGAHASMEHEDDVWDRVDPLHLKHYF